MLVQRRRRWADVVQMSYKCFVFAGCQLALAYSPIIHKTTSREGQHGVIMNFVLVIVESATPSYNAIRRPRIPSRHKTLKQSWFDVGPAS